MTRKRYEGLVRNLMREINEHNVALGGKKLPDMRVIRPKFGSIIKCGRHKYERLDSYEMAWDVLWEALEPVFK